jgi:hypothetical protein
MVYHYAYSTGLQSRACCVTRSAALSLLSAATQFKNNVRIATHLCGDAKILNEINMNMNKGNVFRRIRKISKNECRLRHVCPSVRIGHLRSFGWIFIKFDI